MTAMNHFRQFRPRIVCLLLCAMHCNTGVGAEMQSKTYVEPLCTQVENFQSHPLSVLPPAVQAKIRRAIDADISMIVRDPAMGLTDTKLQDVKLTALQIDRSPRSARLYAVDWDDPSFGVNGFNCIVEVTPQGARSLTPPLTPSLQNSMGGFGVQILTAEGRDPEVMIASKGYKEGVGAEAEAAWFHKAGRFYIAGPCPAGCQKDLNSR